jgi:hypothetical protein
MNNKVKRPPQTLLDLEINTSKNITIHEDTYNNLVSFANAYYSFHTDKVPEYNFDQIINELFDMISTRNDRQKIVDNYINNILCNEKGVN